MRNEIARLREAVAQPEISICDAVENVPLTGAQQEGIHGGKRSFPSASLRAGYQLRMTRQADTCATGKICRAPKAFGAILVESATGAVALQSIVKIRVHQAACGILLTGASRLVQTGSVLFTPSWL